MNPRLLAAFYLALINHCAIGCWYRQTTNSQPQNENEDHSKVTTETIKPHKPHNSHKPNKPANIANDLGKLTELNGGSFEPNDNNIVACPYVPRGKGQRTHDLRTFNWENECYLLCKDHGIQYEPNADDLILEGQTGSLFECVRDCLISEEFCYSVNYIEYDTSRRAISTGCGPSEPHDNDQSCPKFPTSRVIRPFQSQQRARFNGRCQMFKTKLGDRDILDGNNWQRNPKSTYTVPKCPPSGVVSSSDSVECGKQHPDFPYHLNSKSHRIVNGVEANPHSWPWQLYLAFPTSDKKLVNCGAILIRVKKGVEKSDIILTAAHCIFDETKDPIERFNEVYVLAGAHNFTDYDRGRQRAKALKIIVHDNYNPKNDNCYEDDIAMIILDEPFLFSKTVRPLCLPKSKTDTPETDTCISTGWGETNDNRVRSNTLQQVNMPIVSADECKKHYKSDTFIEEKMQCAGDKDSGTFKGDSGGPFMCLANGVWKLYGITSCSANSVKGLGKPRLFTRVARYLDWITERLPLSVLV